MAKPHLSPASGPFDFSPASTASLLALVAAKADDGLFSVKVTNPTNARFTGYGDCAQWATTPGQCRPPGLNPSLSLLLRPRTPASATLYSALARYRGRAQPFSLVADSALSVFTSNLLAQQALEWMNGLDLLYPVNRVPNPEPDVAGLALDPRGNIIGKLLGYQGPKVTDETEEEIVIEVEREDDGRFLAEVPAIPGVMAYGATEDEAVRRVLTLALQVMADRELSTN